MTQLEKMIESCEEFEQNPKTNGFTWNIGRITDYSLRTNIGFIKFWLLDTAEFWFRIGDANNIKLQATTAHEAAAEALELCRKEAQKLVELLGELKDENYTKEFLEWRNKYFDEYKGERLSWIPKKDYSKRFTDSQLFAKYELAFKQKPFLNNKP